MATTAKTTNLSALMQTYYDRLFVDTAKHHLVHEEGAQVRPLPQGEGKVVYFTRYTPLAIVSSALTEGANPTPVSPVANNISVTVSEFGLFSQVSKLLSLTAIDPKLKSFVELFGQNAGESRDKLVRDHALVGGAAQLAGGKTALSAVAITDTLSADEIRKAVRTLKVNKAQKYSDGFFLGKTNPYHAYDLQNDTVWVNAKTYSDVKDLYTGEIGELYGVRFLESTNGKKYANAGASNADLWSTFIHGKNSFGVTDLEGDEKKIYVKTPGPQDTSNPLDRYYTVGWAMTFAPKQLVSEWVVEVKAGATGQT